MTDVSYRRAAGAVWAFLIVGVCVKLAELTWTFEHRWLLPWDNELVRRTGQVSLVLRFSWQEFAIAAGLFALLALVQRWRPAPGVAVRRSLLALRIFLGVTSLASVIGISYYAVYQTHFTVDDLEYLIWAKHLAASAGPWTMLSVQLVWSGGRIGAACRRPSSAVWCWPSWGAGCGWQDDPTSRKRCWNPTRWRGCCSGAG
jgi:hypothetical protein